VIRSTLPGTSVRLALLLCLASSCSIFGSKKSGLNDVDDLVDRVERLHVDAELARARSDEAMGSLETLVDPGFRGDALVAFERLLDSIEASEDQADSFASTFEDMEDAAEDLFEGWEESLEEMTNETFRARSESRLAETRHQFESVRVAAGPVAEAYETFNGGLRDHALFLEHDLNPASVKLIAKDVRVLSDRAKELEMRLENCMKASEEYVRSSSFPGQALTRASD